ncbi:MAG: ribosome maturation factor RimM [Tissierella sp.]|uniref:ribosome maturation factor RimM n=1 Tax=Tissierella sp. TaxID=41274 RepID=UPI003F9B71BA
MNYIVIGKIINTHGIKGEVKLDPHTDDLKRYSDLNKIYIGDEKDPVEIENVRYHKNMVLLKLKEFNNINEVLFLKGEKIYIDEIDRVKLPDDKYFIYELIGCKVFDIEGKFVGDIKEILQNPSNDVYVIKDKEKEYLIPAVKEFIKEVNIIEKKVIIDTIEGMIE